MATRRLLAARPEIARRYVRAYCQGVYRFRTHREFGLSLLQKYTGEGDATIIAETWVLFARLMGGMMFPSIEGMRNAIHVLHRLGVLPQPFDPYSYVDLALVAAAEREGFFSTFMGRRPP